MKSTTKNTINFILFIMLLINFFIILLSGYTLWLIIPRAMGTYGSLFCMGSGVGPTGNWITFIGYNRYEWVIIHNWVAIVLLGILLLHVILHWNWIISLTKRIKLYLCVSVLKVKAIEQYAVTVLLIILFTIECLSGLVVWLIMPRGAQDYYNMLDGFGRTFWGLQRNVWVDIHAWLAIVIIAILIIHILLNWRWVVTISKDILNYSIGFLNEK